MAITLFLSVAGWTVKTTVSNMILENRNSDLELTIKSLSEDLRWCRIYGGSILSPRAEIAPFEEEEGQMHIFKEDDNK